MTTLQHQRFLDYRHGGVDPDGYIIDESNQDVLSHVWDTVFQLLDGLTAEGLDKLDAGEIAQLVTSLVERELLRNYLEAL